MFDDFKAYFQENIISSYLDYIKVKNSKKAGISNDLKSATNAATNLYHLREHLPSSVSKTRSELSLICPDYDLLGDIVNATKHKKIKNNNPQVSDAKNIFEQIVVTEYQDKLGPFSHKEKCVIVKLNDGTERDLFEILTNVINMWLKVLNKANLIDSVKQFSLKPKRLPRRSKQNQKLDLQLIKGIRFRQVYKMQKYNYSTGQAEPIDLSDKKFEMRIYKPQFDVSMELTDNNGEKIKLDIQVDKIQKRKLESLKTDQSRLRLFMKMAKEQGVINDFKEKPSE